METELIIQNGKTIYSPAVTEGVEWSTERIGSPGQLAFKVLEDKEMKITERDTVRIKNKGSNIRIAHI